MRLACNPEPAAKYTSNAQRARVITEAWGATELYCVACPSDRITPTPVNTHGVDFFCPVCDECYQLKSRSGWSETRVLDAGYDAMMKAVRSDRNPNLFVMQYLPDWTVRNLLLVPRFFFGESAIEARKPLSPTARRAGWVGCNILLSAIPADGKLRLIRDGETASPASIRHDYKRMAKLAEMAPESRGWTLDVLAQVRALAKREFTLSDIYAHEALLQGLHPSNHNVRPKIRQQLQVLRDMGLLQFRERGRYRVL